MAGDDAPAGRARRRFAGWCGLAVRRVRTRAFATAPGRIGASVAGVAIAVALLLVVTGLAIGMVAPATGVGGDEYWIEPESGAGSPLVATGDPQLGEAHEAAERIRATDGVEAATPVLIEVLSVETDAGDRERLVAVGVHPDAGIDVYGISPTAIADDDRVVASDGAASLLSAERGDRLAVGGDRELRIAGVEDGAGLADASPIVVMEFATLQAITGADDRDVADRFVVEADDDAAAELEGLYEGATVRSSAEVTTDRLLDADLPLALSLSALLVAVVVGTIFVAVATAMEVAADRRELATLRAIGIAGRRRIGLYVGQSLLVATAGGVVGVALGLVGIRAANAAAAAVVGIDGPIESHSLFVGYGLGAAWLIGLCAIPAVIGVVRRVESEVGGRG